MSDMDGLTKVITAFFTLIIIVALSCAVFNIADTMVDTAYTNMEHLIAENTENTSDLTASTDKPDSTDEPNYITNIIKDIEGNAVGITVTDTNKDVETNVIDKVEITADTVVNTDSYVDNSQTITNEAPNVSYVIPLTVAIIAIFIVVMFDKYIKHKKEQAEHTEKILSTPLQTFSQTEAEQLKSKYQ